MRTNTSLSSRISESNFLRYVVAVSAALFAALICSGLHHIDGNSGCYVLLLLAVAFCSWYCGVGPSIIAVMIGSLGSIFGFIPEIHSYAGFSRSESIGLAVFLLSSAIVILLGESRRRQNQALTHAQSELEAKVRDRTADLASVNRSLRELSARLMQLQDDERRRIARELHDSVGQTLAALAMNLSLVRNHVEKLTSMAAALKDSETLVQDMNTEVRTISHLLHPPLLDESGLSSALRWYVDGFARRSGINVNLELPEDFGRLTREVETAIFRVVQECLTNIHRHSESQVARIRLRRLDAQVLVDIEDKGKGISPEKQEEMASAGTPGVGIRGMRERLRQLGGSLEIKSGHTGTIVTVRLPTRETPATENVSIAGPAAA